MKSLLLRLLPNALVNRLRRLRVALALCKPYRRALFALSDVPRASHRCSYALKSEKDSPGSRRVMRKLLSYPGAGPIGPNKFWEYPWVISNLDIAPGMAVLDAGCGRAPNQYLLAELGCRVSAIDPMENVGWHGIDRRLAEKFGLTIDYRVEGMEKISYPDETFDRVMSVSVIEHCRARAVEVLGRAGPKTRLKVVLDEGKNRHIRRLFGALQDPKFGTPLKVLELKRTAVGGLELDVPSGQWRFLSDAEAARLL